MAGVAAAWIADLFPGARAWRTAPSSASWYERAGGALTVGCAGLAMLPDVDLLWLPLSPRSHRTMTHSVGAVMLVGLVAAILRKRKGSDTSATQISDGVRRVRPLRGPVGRFALTCAAAYSTHLLLDWLGVDNFPPRGIRALWPFSDAWFISDLDLFWQTSRRQLATAAVIRLNLLAIVRETAILLPILVGLWLVRVKALAGLSTELARGDHAAK
jgi:membrane-bound metal-dependent hydrolase YbcI (DUF457 family)